jgi:chromosome segregation ATPase|tara:strand:+ start:40 stop:333 length:294 start_codon:yes stop_codon:yes gene_type:complete
MSDKELMTALKHQIADLTEEKNDAIKLSSEKDSKIKQLLIQLENANDDTHTMGKKIQELEAEMVKKSRIKRIINEKIDEVLEKKEEIKDEPSVDNDD